MSAVLVPKQDEDFHVRIPDDLALVGFLTTLYHGFTVWQNDPPQSSRERPLTWEACLFFVLECVKGVKIQVHSRFTAFRCLARSYGNVTKLFLFFLLLLGAVMTESDLDSDVPSVPLYWFGRRWASTSFRLDNISTKFQKIRERPYLFTASDIHSLPILRAIDVGTEDRNLPCQVMPDVGRTSLITRQDVTSDCESSPRYPQFAGGPSANEKMINVVQGRQEDMKECKNEILFISRSQPVTCSDSVDEGISHDCVLEDLE